jgi:hypothetical protein
VMRMDAIEKMRRINDLTKELKQHGFAESSFEAIEQANQIYGTHEVSDDVKHGIIENSMHEKLSKGDQMEEEYSARKTDKLSQNVEQLTAKINEIIKAINDIDARLATMDTRINSIKNRQDQLRVEPKPEPKVELRTPEPKPVQASVEQAPQADSAKKDEYALNQRTGNFQSNDVAIDKMFYYGKK